MTAITPAETNGVTVVGHRRVVHGVRDPLRAGVLVLDDGQTKAAIVTLDTLKAWDELVPLARERVSQETGTPSANIMVAASHNHSGPGFAADSPWGRELINKLGAAAAKAAGGEGAISHVDVPSLTEACASLGSNNSASLASRKRVANADWNRIIAIRLMN